MCGLSAFAPETESTRPADPATRTSNERDLPLDPLAAVRMLLTGSLPGRS
jgi:hypothetical protein